jgi:uncharacterized protein YecT (DUF1311 family)
MPLFRLLLPCMLLLLPVAKAQQPVFQKTIAADQMAFLSQVAGLPSDKLIRDKQFRRLMHSFVPDCTFHYGHDMPLAEALEFAIKGSGEPIQIREDRYLVASGRSGPWLLEHDEDYCAPAAGTIALPRNNCRQINADAADIDLNAAYYVEQTHHATNATAWMITGADRLAWVQVRNNTCAAGAEPLRCRIIMTRQRTAVILRRP